MPCKILCSYMNISSLAALCNPSTAQKAAYEKLLKDYQVISDIDGTATTTSQLDISFQKVVGPPPTPESFAEKIWRKQGFL